MYTNTAGARERAHPAPPIMSAETDAPDIETTDVSTAADTDAAGPTATAGAAAPHATDDGTE